MSLHIRKAVWSGVWMMVVGLTACGDSGPSAPGPSNDQHPLPVDAISASQTSTCVLANTGDAYCWGGNQYGQLGTGDTTSSNVPRPAAAGRRFRQISVGNSYTCGLGFDGAAYCWGYGLNGQLGNGTLTSSLMPVAVAGGITFSAISAGHRTVCGIEASSHHGFCWGHNMSYELGIGDTISRGAPVQVSATLKFKTLRVGLDFVCGVVEAGDAPIYCWGWNGYRQASATAGDVKLPTPLAGSVSTSPIDVIAGAGHVCALLANAASYCWGQNFFGELGAGSTAATLATTPTPVAGGVNFAGMTAAKANNTFDGSCGWTSAGAAYCWGINDAGQLGSMMPSGVCTYNGTYPCTGTPVAVNSTFAFVAMASGGEHTCGLTTNHTVACWGLNSSGQLGNGTRSNTATPTLVTANFQTP